MTEAEWEEMPAYPYEAASSMHYGGSLNGHTVMTYKDGTDIVRGTIMTTTDSLQVKVGKHIVFYRFLIKKAYV